MPLDLVRRAILNVKQNERIHILGWIKFKSSRMDVFPIGQKGGIIDWGYESRYILVHSILYHPNSAGSSIQSQQVIHILRVIKLVSWNKRIIIPLNRGTRISAQSNK